MKAAPVKPVRCAIYTRVSTEQELAAKLLSPNPVKRLGMQTLGPMLGVLGMKLIAVEDEDTLKRFSHRRMLRNASQVRVHQTRKPKKSRSRRRK